ncbi:transposase (ISmav2) [Legionella moravica]|uniref:Transposase (ISmav2) n=1 Tax=Legionella moravica TaxID=39962 RepID=A0A378JXN3_9GAMM|nr:DDE-type integrase/transposase/recombinase [Legionella moravica]KTD35667.1 transposase (ISmav2) [Legionella moravica]STX62797.1 transposase (ISmav2) [Legionella moravica]
MPWKETVAMRERIKFISNYMEKSFDSFSELCAFYGVSRKTGYKYVNQFKESGIDGLKERSRSPHRHGLKTAQWMEDNILKIRKKHTSWGGKKIHNWLQQEYPETEWPSKSTIDDILKRNGLVRKRRVRGHVAPYNEPFSLCTNPNDVWSIDFMGQFYLGNKKRCYPLTVTDNFSRYLLDIRAFDAISSLKTKETLENLFMIHGLPKAIKSDNGVPFASTGIAGLSQLSIWLIKLGIIPERIRKGHPEENGRHERMHLTLKIETTLPPMNDQVAQQIRFDEFRKEFNEERPHEGIDFQRPFRLYSNSERAFPKRLPKIEYDTRHVETRKVRSNGTIKWKGKEIFLSELLIGETIGFIPRSDDQWNLHFSFMPISIFNEREQKMYKI